MKNKVDLRDFMKVEPFLYNALFILFSIRMMFAITELTAYLLNTMIFCSPFIVVMNMIRSKLGHFCKYHRLAFSMPLIPYLSVFINDYIYQFDKELLYIELVITIIITIISIYCGIKVFRNGK